MLAYDPCDPYKGLFIDVFKFPSACSCHIPQPSHIQTSKTMVLMMSKKIFFFKCWPVKERNYLKLTSELANVAEKLIKSSSCTIIVIAVAVPHSLILIIIYLSQIIDTKLPFLWCCELLRVQIKNILRRTKKPICRNIFTNFKDINSSIKQFYVLPR